MKIGAV